MKARIAVLICLTVSHQVSEVSPKFVAAVVAELDGDTSEILHNHHPERIRLNGIDCPEKDQAYGKRARQATSELVFGNDVTLQTYGRDKYGRTIADALLPDGTNVNHTLVKEGWCWWYRKYASGKLVLELLEKEAREGKIELWAEPNPIPPWEWRKKESGSLQFGSPFCFTCRSRVTPTHFLSRFFPLPVGLEVA